MLAEQSLIGALLIKADDVLPVVRGKVSASDFCLDDDKAIYTAACELADNGEVVDPVTVLRRTAENGAKITTEYMRDLMLLTPAWQNAGVYADELIKDSSRLRLKGVVTEALTRLDVGYSVHEASTWLRSEAADVAERTSSGGIISGTETLIDFYKYRKDLEDGKTPAVVRTGYPKLDELLGGGMVVQGLYILAARPSVGKTTFGLNIAEKVAAGDMPVLFVSLEMDLRQITAKRLAIKSGLSSTMLLNSPDSAIDQWKKIADASTELSKHPLMFNLIKSAGVDDVEKMASQIKSLRLVVIDYLGLLRHSEGKSLYEKVTFTSGALKRLARDLGVPVLCLAQLNRESEGRVNREPRISDLRDSGAIEQDADGIILLHEYDTDRDGSAPALLKLILAKNRHGGKGCLDLNFYHMNSRIYQ